MPVYIVGCPRSGNTLVGALLNKHPEVVIHFEANTFYSAYRNWLHDSDRSAESAFRLLQQSLSTEVRKAVAENAADLVDSELRFETREGWGALLDAYMKEVMSFVKPEASVWGDKTPHHLCMMSTVHEVLPSVKFLYVYRDPRAVVESLSDPTFQHASNNRQVCWRIVERYREWYERELDNVPRGVVKGVRYEDLVSDPSGMAKEICDHIDVMYSSSMLGRAGSKVRRSIGWPSDKAWEPIEPQESSRASKDSQESPRLAEIIRRYGYTVATHGQSGRQWSLRYGMYVIVERVGQLVWRGLYDELGDFVLLHLPDYRRVMSWIAAVSARTIDSIKGVPPSRTME